HQRNQPQTWPAPDRGPARSDAAMSPVALFSAAALAWFCSAVDTEYEILTKAAETAVKDEGGPGSLL
uniref:hypothetical protein n=1 Tax=Roseomonas rosulenta TaxID=2748667 RepID=UPI001E460811